MSWYNPDCAGYKMLPKACHLPSVFAVATACLCRQLDCQLNGGIMGSSVLLARLSPYSENVTHCLLTTLSPPSRGPAWCHLVPDCHTTVHQVPASQAAGLSLMRCLRGATQPADGLSESGLEYQVNLLRNSTLSLLCIADKGEMIA